MAKNFALIVCLLLLHGTVVGNHVRTHVRKIYDAQVGVREATGNNDGAIVELYLRNAGLGKGYAWCAAFVKFVFDYAKVKHTITAWSPTAHNKDRAIYFKGVKKSKPRSGDVFTIYYSNLKRIGHTGFVDYEVNSKIYATVEGNTNQAGSREGDGVFRKMRSYHSTFSVVNWID